MRIEAQAHTAGAPGLREWEAEAAMSTQAIYERVAVSGAGRDSTLTVTIRGEFDASTAQGLSEFLEPVLRKGPRNLVLDLAEVGFMDCAAARAIVRTCNARPDRPCLILRRPRPIVRRLLSLTGLDAQCTVRP
jgi:anti-sigma B factor antagonist